ncbi:MAG TPA: DNA-3-methyladenine glycosylase 2 family protein [Chloroflexota bacterium]|nr:DNA-3-methyladenine glycosylase 2 family protein [Chloroflexota bacterium]
MERFRLEPSGPFSLTEANRYFGGWPTLASDPAAIAMAFPVEGWRTSAAVVVRQEASGALTGEVHHSAGEDADAAWRTALAALSADADGSGYAAVGERDPVIGGLQAHFGMVRPVCFHTPYEAGSALVIGHRLSILQTRAIRKRMAEEHGDALAIADQRFHAFPRPQVLLGLDRFGAVFGEKMERVHGLAEAALAGRLDRDRLRHMPYADALADLRSLRGVGAFIAQGILIRGASLADEVSDDEVTAQAVQYAYALPELPDRATILRIAAGWRPYRAWAMVLLHMWLRREGGPAFKRPGRRGARPAAPR